MTPDQERQVVAEIERWNRVAWAVPNRALARILHLVRESRDGRDDDLIPLLLDGAAVEEFMPVPDIGPWELAVWAAESAYDMAEQFDDPRASDRGDQILIAAIHLFRVFRYGGPRTSSGLYRPSRKGWPVA